MSSSPAAVYAAEIAHKSLRGRLTLLSALCTALGMLFIYLLGYLIPVNIMNDQDESQRNKQDYKSCQKHVKIKLSIMSVVVCFGFSLNTFIFGNY